MTGNAFSGLKRASELSSGCYKIQSIDRAMAIMDLLAESVVPLGLADISRALDLDKSTAHRFLVCLLRHHMILRTVKGRYVCDVRLVPFFMTKIAVSSTARIQEPDRSALINR